MAPQCLIRYGFRNFSFFNLAFLSLLPPDTAFGTMGIWSCSPSPELLSREKENISGEKQGREERRREGKRNKGGDGGEQRGVEMQLV